MSDSRGPTQNDHHDGSLMRYWLLGVVPRPFRSRWPLRRFYWQADELADARRRADEMWERLWGSG